VSVQLVSKISNLCDPDPPTSQTDRRTDGQTDGQTDGRHAISIPRYALVHRAVKMERRRTSQGVAARMELFELWFIVNVDLVARRCKEMRLSVFGATQMAQRRK